MKKNKDVATKQKTGTDVESFMAKIEGQLLALGNKIDALLSGQTPVKSPEVKEVPKSLPPSVSAPRPGEVPQGQGRGRRERILHKAVCADCRKDCEIPFKPTGERPVYCKECFSKRKSGPKPGAQHQNPQRVAPQVVNVPTPQPIAAPAVKPAPEVQRRVTVTKKGVGKVTVSEVIAPSRPPAQPRQAPRTEREAAPSKRAQKPAPRSKR